MKLALILVHMVAIIARLRQLVTQSSKQSDDVDNRACNVSGHDWDTSVSGYHASGVPYFGFGKTFTIKKKYHKKCTKCGTAKFPKETIGRVKVNKEDDSLEIL